jgi:ABC-type sulfate/molybdate transport systems ATPase subunit
MELRATDIILARRSFELRATLSVGAETVALVGPSGAGKSSLLRTIAGLERPRSGRIMLGEEVWLDAARGIALKPERRRVGYLPQDYALFPHLSVAANVRFAARRDRPDLLDRLGIASLAAARPAQLSGGERQRVALARALARDPQVLLLDEPFGALDTITRRDVRDELAEILGGVRLPTLLVTHAFEDAAVLADRVGVIDRGEIVQLDTPARVLRHPGGAVVAALTGANILRGTATPVAGGARIEIDGGGHLNSEMTGAGRVELAVHPWTLRLIPTAQASLTDTILTARQHAGTLVLRLTRLTVELSAERAAGLTLEPGTLVGVDVAPADVRVLGPAEP